MEDMSRKIKELRQAQGLTLEQVAMVVGVGKSTVRKWETGMIANMRRDKIASLAKALNTTPAYLMGWDDAPKHKPRKKEYTYDGDNACCSEEENPLLLKIYEYLDTLSQDQLELVLEQLRVIDKEKNDCNESKSTVSDLSQREIQVVQAYRVQNEAVKNAIDKILDLSFWKMGETK